MIRIETVVPGSMIIIMIMTTICVIAIDYCTYEKPEYHVYVPFLRFILVLSLILYITMILRLGGVTYEKS